jgi:hypothetical protein
VIGEFLDRECELPPAGTFSEVISREYSKKNVSGLRVVHAEFVGGMVPSCTVAQRRELDALLRAKIGVTLDSLEKRQLDRINKLRARGRISNDQQYYMIRERVEMIWDDPERVEEFQALQSLLGAYEERVASRGARGSKPRS